MHHKIETLKNWILPSLLILLVLTVLITQLVFPTSGSERFFSGEAETYFQALQKAGFPKDYAAALTELHLLHPTWTFSPLLVTEQESQYTWNYVIDQEMEDPENNIIYSSDTYSAYHHPTNRELYDSGHYQVSRAALEYFMDPRNFLNETDIFQFYSLSGYTQNSYNSVQSILNGTFMETAVLENGMTYAQYFVHLGELFDINPIFLAAKVRQEQGVSGTSPLISGECGDTLVELATSASYSSAELRAFNGYYNYFNINATGKGSFEIYLNAMKYAKNKGSASMADVWGETGAWNTRWKALYGGASFLANNYIGRYQSTVYLQKFNVDSRADNNFAHQYMATVHGALGEAKLLFQSFTTLDLLDHAAHFVIPVYEGMPENPCADPAGGACAQTVQATKRYQYQTEMTKPSRYSVSNDAIYMETEVYSGESVDIKGNVSHHDYAMDGLSYSWDGGEWLQATSGNSLKKSFVCDFSENSTHILVIRGTASYESTAKTTIRTNFLYAVIYVHVIPRPNVVLTYQTGNEKTEEKHPYGSLVRLSDSELDGFVGWSGSDGSFLPSDAEVELKQDMTFSAVTCDILHLDGAALVAYGQSPRLRFSAAMKKEDYDRLCELSDAPISYTVKLQENRQEVVLVLSDVAANFTMDEAEWVRLDALTAPLKESAYQNSFSASFGLNLRYTNGTKSTLPAGGAVSVRSAKQVAEAALADKTVAYSPSLLTLLRSVAEKA
ncbi:MAG: hypothetical protein IJW49_03785 [Clostridia bacterium]|nr:hypothetical protein [Clostridia bacterium]